MKKDALTGRVERSDSLTVFFDERRSMNEGEEVTLTNRFPCGIQVDCRNVSFRIDQDETEIVTCEPSGEWHSSIAGLIFATPFALVAIFAKDWRASLLFPFASLVAFFIPVFRLSFRFYPNDRMLITSSIVFGFVIGTKKFVGRDQDSFFLRMQKNYRSRSCLYLSFGNAKRHVDLFEVQKDGSSLSLVTSLNEEFGYNNNSHQYELKA